MILKSEAKEAGIEEVRARTIDGGHLHHVTM